MLIYFVALYKDILFALLLTCFVMCTRLRFFYQGASISV